MSRTLEVLKLLYPKSIPFEEYENAVHLIQVATLAGSTKRVLKVPEERSLKFVKPHKGGRRLRGTGLKTQVAEFLKKHGTYASTAFIAAQLDVQPASKVGQALWHLKKAKLVKSELRGDGVTQWSIVERKS